jgi:hypothetical protein
MPDITKEMLRAFLHDALPEIESARVEKAVRDQPKVRQLFEEVREEEDRGEHSIGAIWRRENLSCPTRDQLGGYLLQALDPDLWDYIDFHLKIVGCPFCQANLEDLEKRQAEAAEQTRTRRKRIVNSSRDVLRETTGT